jgi:hypothetical protein
VRDRVASGVRKLRGQQNPASAWMAGTSPAMT